MNWRVRDILFLIWIILLGPLIGCKQDDETIVPDTPKDLLEQLRAIEGAFVAEINAGDHFQRLFEIHLEQPVDHRVPNGATFRQKLYLGHVDASRPVAFETEGYSRDEHKTRELSDFLFINQLTVEHRYFGSSVPEPVDWRFLNIWQTAQDHHRIVTLFKDIYPTAWVSSGASKGGDAAIFHRRFFPDDVQATVAYVAPILFEERDHRFLEFYQTAGDSACRERMKKYQRNMLMKLDSFPPLFDDYVNFVNDNFDTDFRFSIPYQSIVYSAIREDYMFEFWSSETESCATIPGDDASIQELFDHFVSVFNIFLFFSDYGVEFWTPWYYQAKTELGNYAIDDVHLQDLVMPFDPWVGFPIPTNFDPTVMADIDQWIKTSSERMIFIYGADDPWTVAAIGHPGSENVITVVNPGTKHGTRISDLSSADQDRLRDKLESWLDL